MRLNIANYMDAPRVSAIAGEALPLGAVCQVVQRGTGNTRERELRLVTAGGQLVQGGWGIAFKVDKERLQVSSSSAPAYTGNRVVEIRSGDQITEVRAGAIMEYDPALLHSSLDPARGGTLPTVGAALAITGTGGLWCTTGTGGAITSPVIGRVFDIVAGKVRIELLAL